MGYIVLRLSNAIRAPKVVLPLLPHLVYALLIGKLFGSASNIMSEMNELSEEDPDILSKLKPCRNKIK